MHRSPNTQERQAVPQARDGITRRRHLHQSASVRTRLSVAAQWYRLKRSFHVVAEFVSPNAEKATTTDVGVLASSVCERSGV